MYKRHGEEVIEKSDRSRDEHANSRHSLFDITCSPRRIDPRDSRHETRQQTTGTRRQTVRDVRSLFGSVTRIRRKTLTALYAFNDDLTDVSARRSYIITLARTHYIYVLGADTRKTRVKCIKKATVRKLPRELPWRCQYQGGHIVHRRGRCCHLAANRGTSLDG